MAGRPQWQDIADDLARRVRTGEFAVGDPIETTAQLVDRYQASASPVKQAVATLRGAGVLRGHAGARVYVARVPAEGEDFTSPPPSLADRVAELERRLDAHEQDHA